jgi:hypothetical protein
MALSLAEQSSHVPHRKPSSQSPDHPATVSQFVPPEEHEIHARPPLKAAGTPQLLLRPLLLGVSHLRGCHHNFFTNSSAFIKVFYLIEVYIGKQCMLKYGINADIVVHITIYKKDVAS